MVSGDSVDHRHPQTLVSAHAVDLSMVSGVSTDHGHQHSPLPQHVPRHIIALSSSTGHGHQHGIRQWVAKTMEHIHIHIHAHTLIIRMASGDSLDHRYLIWPPAVARLHSMGVWEILILPLIGNLPLDLHS